MAKFSDRITLRLTAEEKAVLQEYCDLTTRTQNDVLREYIRTLKKRVKKRKDRV